MKCDERHLEQKFYARPDKPDSRDWIFKSTLFDVPQEINLEEYIEKGVPVLDQAGEGEGACTGFALATACHYLLRRRKVRPDKTEVSARMLYKMAKRTNEWPGEEYKGHSARAAIKGWHKHGVSSKERFNTICEKDKFFFTDELAEDATKRPLAAYYRVNHRNPTDMHAALAEVGILYATAILHSGWHNVGKDGIIKFDRVKKLPDAHAFAIVAYDEHGFWIQNSLGVDWGKKGFAHISYNDWGKNVMDVWAVALGVPKATPPAGWRDWKMIDASLAYRKFRPYLIGIGNNGLPDPGGHFGTNEDDIKDILTKHIPNRTQDWTKKRILLYVHGGLTSETDAIKWLINHRFKFLDEEIFPLVFAWRTDFSSIMQFINAEGPLLPIIPTSTPPLFPNNEQIDAGIEWLVRNFPILGNGIGKSLWDEIKENAILATTTTGNLPDETGAARLVLGHLNDWMEKPNSNVEVHVAGFSAGSVLLGPLVQKFATNGMINGGPMNGEPGYNKKISSCTLWAPACPIDLFKEYYQPVIEANGIGKFALFTLDDVREQDDTVGDVFNGNTINIYNKSLLYLVSNALEEKFKDYNFADLVGEPLLGMEKWINDDQDIQDLFTNLQLDADWVKAPNSYSGADASDADNHGDFSHDIATLEATIARILAV